MRPPPFFASRTPRRRVSAAFSLTEIVVSVVLVALVAVILLPAVQRARAQAQTSHCIANLRNLGLIHRVWRNENGDRLWDARIDDFRPSRFLYEAGMVRSASEMQCPSATRLVSDDPAFKAWYDYSPTGGLNTAYAREFKTTPVSYGCNRFAMYATNHYGSGGQFTVSYRAFTGVESKIPLFMDATIWNIDRVVWDSHVARPRIALRHQKRANVVFLDGHVESLDQQEVLDLTPYGVRRSQY